MENEIAKDLKPSEKAKLAGYESLNEVSAITGKTVQSLIYTAKNNPLFFEGLLEQHKKPELSLEEMLKLHKFKSLKELSERCERSTKTLKIDYEKRPDLFRALLEVYKD